MGADSLSDFPRWHQPDEILDLAEVIAVNRGETSPIEAEQTESQSNSSPHNAEDRDFSNVHSASVSVPIAAFDTSRHAFRGIIHSELATCTLRHAVTRLSRREKISDCAV